MTQSYEQEELLAASRVRKMRRTITEADLVNAVNGGFFDVALVPNMAAATLAQSAPRNYLPADAILIGGGPKIKLDQQFTGGGVTTMTVSIGTAAAPTLIATAFDVFGSAASGLFVDMVAGAQRVAPAGGQLLVARFTPSAGQNLSALTAGSCTIEVYFSVPGRA